MERLVVHPIRLTWQVPARGVEYHWAQQVGGRVPKHMGLSPRVNVARGGVLLSVLWPWGISHGSILGWMNIHLPAILMFTRGRGTGF